MSEYSNLSVEEIKAEISRLEQMSADYKNEEQGIKLTLNSIYGALGNQWFACFNQEVAESVTLQGQDLIKFAEKVINKYFHEIWHLDKELHEKIGVRNVRQITDEMVIYVDTDSCMGSTELIIKNQENLLYKIEIGDYFRFLSKSNDIFLDQRGNEIIEPDNEYTLNYTDTLKYSGIKKVIRHKVKKKKWRIISESGKEIIVTNDHSVTVFRDGKKLSLKPSEINILTDEILEVIADI